MAKIRLGNLKGPKGDKGDVGPRGPQGIQGPPGTAENIDLTPFVKKTENTTLTGQYTFTNNTPIKLNGYSVVSENNRILFKNNDNKNVFAFDADTVTHNDKSLLTQDKANTLYAPVGDYALRSSLTDYATKTYVNYGIKNFITTTTADSTYAKKTDLNSYATTASLSGYVTTANANTTYLSKTDAAGTYATKTQLNGYATTASLNNYLTTANASTTYLSKADAESTYAKKADAGNSTTFTLANHIFESNPTNLVIKNKANQPILTVYPSVAYLNGREVLNQFKADQLYASKTALNSYATTASLSGYVTTTQYNNDMNSLLTALRNVNN